MDAQVQTGQTKALDETTLVAKSLSGTGGENVVVLLQVEANSPAGRNFQKEFLDIVTTALLESEGEAAERLDGALKELNGLIKGMLLGKTIGDLHAIVALTAKDGALHVSHAGRAEAYVVRSGAASQITEYTKGKPAPAFVHIASGQLEPRDMIILSTQRLLRSLTPAQLAQLAAKPDSLLDDIKSSLESEQEQAALAMVSLGSKEKENTKEEAPVAAMRPRGRNNDRRAVANGRRAGGNALAPLLASASGAGAAALRFLRGERVQTLAGTLRTRFTSFRKDLRDPSRKRRAHLLLIAGVLASIVVIWALAHLTLFSQRSQTKAELEALVQEIESDMKTAENRRLTGEMDAANAILKRAEERAKQVIDNESGYYRDEAMEIFARIQSKREELNNIVRLSPRVVANIAAKNPNIKALGFLGFEDEEFLVYDRQDTYRVLHNSIDDPNRVADEELVLDGADFPRYQTQIFQTTGNGMIETIAGQATSMKTEDPAGWIAGKDMKTYLRFLYVLSPENNQIYKYERLSNRYAAPSEYNVNGDLSDALDIAIDGNVFVLKEKGQVVKLLRGETQPYTIRNAPDGLLDNATKIYKVTESNTYFLDPVRSRVVIVTDGGPSGESSYVKQYVLESEEIGELTDIFVNPDETRLYVSDEKRIYVVDLTAN
jgi:hypothetical protein